jgi:hypothetical protein
LLVFTVNPWSKPLINTFCSSLGSTLLFIESTTIHPLYLWVISDAAVVVSMAASCPGRCWRGGSAPSHRALLLLRLDSVFGTLMHTLCSGTLTGFPPPKLPVSASLTAGRCCLSFASPPSPSRRLSLPPSAGIGGIAGATTPVVTGPPRFCCGDTAVELPITTTTPVGWCCRCNPGVGLFIYFFIIRWAISPLPASLLCCDGGLATKPWLDCLVNCYWSLSLL